MQTMNITKLSEATGVTPRNVKRYIHERLLPPPDGRTRSARYSEVHRRDLIRIESLRAAGLSLDQIRAELVPHAASSDGPVARLKTSVEGPAVEYRYQIAEGVFIVFASAEGQSDSESQIEIARRCHAAIRRVASTSKALLKHGSSTA